MHIKNSLVFMTVLTICFVLVVGCGSSGGTREEPEVKALKFSNMRVETSTRTGFFGGRYASFEVTGSVTNKTDNPINKDNMPSISYDGENVKVDMSQEKLLTGETCDVSWEKELTIDGSSIPSLSFTGSVEFTGLDDCEEDLNGQLQAIAGEYAAQDNAKEEERKAQEQAEAEKAKKKEDARESLAACEGKTALEALEVAKKTEYTPVFKDSYGVDVSSDLEQTSAESELGKALVSEVEIKEAGWFSDAEVVFTLDYTDPTEKKRRDEEAAAEEARSQADKELTSCEGKSADEALEVANKSSYTPCFIDSYGADVTDAVKDASSDPSVHSATVTMVEIKEGGWFSAASVTFTLDYTDLEAKAKRDEEEAAEAARKQAEEDKRMAEEQLQKDIEACKGKSVAHAYKLIKNSGYSYVFRLPSEIGLGEDITADVKDKLYKGARKRTNITEVSIHGNDVTFTVERQLAMTADDNDELRAVLQVRDDFDQSIGSFADKYYGKNIEFDGCFADVYAEDRGKSIAIYRYTVLIHAMDYDPDNAIGPAFHVRDLKSNQFNWIGNEPSSLKTGQNVHIVARLGGFDEKHGLYEITPIETKLR